MVVVDVGVVGLVGALLVELVVLCLVVVDDVSLVVLAGVGL